MYLFLWILSVAWAQTPSTTFTSNTANILEQGSWSVGIFGPLRYGLRDDLELSIHPGWAVLAPHIGIKKSYGTKADWLITSQHRIGYPSPMLKFFARPGIGGMLAADSVIPHIVNSDNQVLLSKELKGSVVTISSGVSLAISFGESDYRTLDVPYAYRKTAMYQNYVSVQAGMGWEKMFTDRLGYRYALDVWYLPLADSTWTVEESNSLIVQLGEKSQINIGGNIVVGEYPYGINWHILPTFDTVFVW